MVTSFLTSLLLPVPPYREAYTARTRQPVGPQRADGLWGVVSLLFKWVKLWSHPSHGNRGRIHQGHHEDQRPTHGQQLVELWTL